MSRMDDPGADDFGTLERAGDHTVLRYRRGLAHPPPKVWRALTEDEHLAAWFPTAIESTRASRRHPRGGLPERNSPSRSRPE